MEPLTSEFSCHLFCSLLIFSLQYCCKGGRRTQRYSLKKQKPQDNVFAVMVLMGWGKLLVSKSL